MKNELDNSNFHLNQNESILLAGLTLEYPACDLLGLIREYEINLLKTLPLISMSFLHIIAQKKTETSSALLSDLLVEGLIEPDDLNIKDGNAMFPIHYAVLNDNKYTLDLLLSFDADLTVQDGQGNTPLHHAVYSSNSTIAEMLMQSGSPVDVRNAAGMSVKDIAQLNGLKNILDALSMYEEVSKDDIKLYDPDIVADKLDGIGDDSSSTYGLFLADLEDNSPYRKRMPLEVSVIEELSLLKKKFPNFDVVIDYLCEELSLMAFAEKPFIQFRPVLMHGAPGTGKTRFAREVSKILSLPFYFADGGSLSSGFSIAGINPSYKSAKPGLVCDFLLSNIYCNGILFLDEIDKLGSNSESSQVAPLYTLLTPETSNKFKDEFVSIEMDCSYLNWIATANNINSIPKAIQSRFQLIEVRTPVKSEVEIIIDSILEDIERDKGSSWSKRFDLSLPEGFKDELISCPVRELRNILLKGISKAAIHHLSEYDNPDKKIILKREYFDLKPQGNSSMGFV